MMDPPPTPSPAQSLSPNPAQSPAIRAIQREEPPGPSLSVTGVARGPGSLASVRSGRDLIKAAQDEPTIFVPSQLYTFLTSPEHTVTACMANSTVDMPVRIVAEHLFGLGYGSFGLWTGEHPARRVATKEPAFKSVKGWLGRLTLGKRGESPKRKSSKDRDSSRDKDKDRDSDMDGTDASSQLPSDDSEGEDEQWRAMRPLSLTELKEVRRCGQWHGADPSDLFLNIYAQALLALEQNALNGLVSPALMGECGVAPLTIISHSLDIVRHYAMLIERAKHEIFFTTNVWEASEAAQIVADALRSLSRKVMERGGEKVVVKIMYDRGVADGGAHQRVDPQIYSSPNVGLPSPEEIPGCALEVQNYHIPPVGSFHQKTVIVDREVALLSSNNVQNRDDVGFMVQLEGPIVQSIYDTAILSWWMSFRIPLPLLSRPPEYAETLGQADFVFGDAHPDVAAMGDLDAIAERTRHRLVLHPSPSPMASPVLPAESPGLDDRSSVVSTPAPASAPFRPVVVHSPHNPFPVAMVNRTPRGRRGCGDAFVPQNQAWLAGFKFAQSSVFLQTPTFSAKPIVMAALDAVRRGVVVEIYADLEFDVQGVISADGKANQRVAAYMYSQLSAEHRPNLRVYWYTAKGDTSPLGTRGSAHTCHIKLMIVDDQIAVQGNGNADVSSWYHAQEINILVDSPLLCAEWRSALDANQDTRAHGRVGDDGVWRDAAGRTLPAAPAQTPASMPRTPVRETPVRDVRNREPRQPQKRDSTGLAAVKRAAGVAGAAVGGKAGAKPATGAGKQTTKTAGGAKPAAVKPGPVVGGKTQAG